MNLMWYTFWPWIAIFWLACGILSGAIASSKGRNGFGWFFFGCIFGMLGLAVAACMPRLEPFNPELHPDRIPCLDKKPPAFSTCTAYVQGSDGKWYIAAQAKATPGGVEALVAARAKAKAGLKASIETKTCPFCAETIKTTAKVCRYCGRDLPDRKESTEAEKSETEASMTDAA